MFEAIADGFNYLFDFLGYLLGKMMDGLWWLLQPLFDLLNIVFQFIYWIGVVIVKIIFLIFSVGKLLVGLITGLFSTLFGLGFTGRLASLPSSYMDVYTHLRPHLQALQLDKVAYVIQFSIWLFTAFMALRIIGNMRGGGGTE